MYDYARIAATATRLIEKFGAPATLDRTVSSDYNTVSSEVESSNRVFGGVAARIEYSLRDIDGEMIRRGDVRLFVGVKTIDGAAMPEPEPNDRITFDGSIWKVIACSPIKPATTAVAYDVQARK